MQVARDLPALHAAQRRLPRAGEGVSFVPTMGALHEGHLRLMRRAAAQGRPSVISIFVNPTQFGPGEDFDRYPRMLERDLEAARSAGIDVAFTPGAHVVYPPGEPIAPPPLPDVATRPNLEDALRPGHFAGVCQVVARLFDLVRPAVAVFGEKDYQQLLVIEAMVEAEKRATPERWPGLRIERHETVRDPDGLAMSSRNAYLAPEARDAAQALCGALQAAREARGVAAAERLMRETLRARGQRHGLHVEYAVVRDDRTLLPVASMDRPTRALIAARLGTVRLIDNAPMPVSHGNGAG